ncbi:MAG: LCP family protein [Patescibacteria group bacterium]|nr:LCP family protein [Patescibacteria group bacterium]
MTEKIFAKLNIIKTLFSKNRLLAFSVLFFIGAVIVALALIFGSKSSVKESSPVPVIEEVEENPISHTEQVVVANEPVLKPHLEVLNPSELFNVLVLGIDRRYQTQESYRTDIMLIVTVNPKLNKIVLTSIPRDLWAGDMKINGVYVTYGYDAMKEEIKKITGQEVDRFIRVDFDALAWVVDAMGGVDVDVERGFTDSQYPNDRQGDANEGITVDFNAGVTHMDGETALIFSRSRKGDNGEGSDFARMRRQQVLLKNMPSSFLETAPKNIFNPFVLQNFYELITQHIKTDMNIKDMGVVYDLLKDRGKYTVEHFVVDYEYLVNPPIEDYGQWVVIPKDGDYTPIHTKINSLLQ